MLKAFWRLGSVVALCACAAGLVLPSAASATTQALVVTTTADTDQSGVGQCALAGPCTLREAVNQANLDTGDAIAVPAGTFTLNPSYGPLVFTSSATVTGNALAPTVISGGDAIQIVDVESPASVTLGQVTLEDGQSGSGSDGGAGIVQSGASLTVEGDVIADNTATGGRSAGAIADLGALAVYGSTITGNQAIDGYAGGITVESTTPLLVVDTTFSGNTGNDGGGGLALIFNGASAAVTGSTFSSNTATTGYGGGIDEINTSTLTLTNSTLDENTAAVSGGGISTNGPSTNTLINDTVADNTSTGSGTQIDNFGSLSLENTILAGSASNCAGNAPTDTGHNLDSADSCGFSTAAGDQINTDPDLGPLRNNGGPTDTMALPAGSPAINAGSNTGCPAIDQRGVARPQQGVCDIGAYEIAPPSLSSASATGITQTSATLGAVASNPDAQGATVTFQYGKTTSYGSTATASLASFSGSTPLTAGVALSPDTTYHYRVIVANSDGAVAGGDQQFTTPAVPNTFTFGKVKVSAKGVVSVPLTGSWSGHFTGKATFTARVNNHHKKTFEYGTASVKISAAGRVTLKISVRGKAAKELKKLGHVTVTLTVTFAPTGGSSHTGRHNVTVKRSKRGRYS